MHSDFAKSCLQSEYTSTRYYIKQLNVSFHINQKNLVLRANDKKEFQPRILTWLTAENPLSVKLNASLNKVRTKKLAGDLSGYDYYACDAIDPLNKWPTESGFLVSNLKPKEARHLAYRYQQKAILTYRFGQKVRLQYCIHHLGDPNILLNNYSLFLWDKYSQIENLKLRLNSQVPMVAISIFSPLELQSEIAKGQLLYLNPNGAFSNAVSSLQTQDKLQILKQQFENLKLDS